MGIVEAESSFGMVQDALGALVNAFRQPLQHLLLLRYGRDSIMTILTCNLIKYHAPSHPTLRSFQWGSKRDRTNVICPKLSLKSLDMRSEQVIAIYAVSCQLNSVLELDDPQ